METVDVDVVCCKEVVARVCVCVHLSVYPSETRHVTTSRVVDVVVVVVARRERRLSLALALALSLVRARTLELARGPRLSEKARVRRRR